MYTFSKLIYNRFLTVFIRETRLQLLQLKRKKMLEVYK